MAITTCIVTNPKVCGVCQVNDRILKIHNQNPNEQHNVIVTSINKKRGTARVKTITSLEKRIGNNYRFKNHKLSDVKNGNIVVIPRSQFNTRFLSGINHNGITVPLNKLHYKNVNDRTVFPKRYSKLIFRK